VNSSVIQQWINLLAAAEAIGKTVVDVVKGLLPADVTDAELNTILEGVAAKATADAADARNRAGQ
jgi:hypothetical protein